MLKTSKANGLPAASRSLPSLLLLTCALGLALAAAGAQAQEKFPNITETEDVIDWIIKWTGSEFYPSQYGPPGWPGKDPELMGLYGYRGNNWGWPEMIPYPDAPEHVRVYIQRYMPMYPLYNARTLVKNFRATELPGLAKERIVQYAEPVYRVPKYRYPDPAKGIFTDAIKLGKYRRAVTAVRFDQHHPPIELDLGRLKESAYAVRVIASTESEKVQQSTKRLVVHFEVNDGLEGEVNAYKKRCAATDQFYSMAEFSFMAPTEREYKIKLWIDDTSELPLYVYNIDLHDRLAQLANRPGKKTASFYDEKKRAAEWRVAKGGLKKDARAKKERFDADAELWQNLPRMNSQIRGDGRFWSTAVESVYRLPQGKIDDGMGIDIYGSDMIWNVPEEEYAGSKYEFRYQAAALTGRYWNLQRQTYYGKAKEYGLKVRRVRRSKGGAWSRDLKKYETNGDEEAGRAVAVRLAMIAWMNIFNLDGNRQRMRIIDCIPEITWNQGDQAFRRRKPCHHGAFEKVEEFDSVFPYIRGNRDLAESLGRFVPWIKTVEDMQRFFEVGLLQLPAHENMIYQRYNDYSQGAWMTFYIGAQQDKEITRPWLEWIFRYVWTYPRMPAGVDETMFMSWTRDGTSTIGSTFYAHASITVLRDILRNLSPLAGDQSRILPPKLRAPELKSRAFWEGRFSQDAMVAGGYRFWVGDVSGPSRRRWVVSGKSETDGKVDARNKSRVLSNWFGVLETAVAAEDFRYRRAAGLRVGNGMGHAHNDPLDLQIWALGVPLSGDWGCRGGYCVPGTGALLSHNTVVAGALLDDCRHRWISSIADTAGARYLMGQVKVPGLYGRQIAMIDVDDPSPNSYTVDIFRVRGGDKPYYAFHGPPPDEFYTNIEKLEKGYPDGSPGPLIDPKHNWHGKIPARFTANWRMRRDPGVVEWVPSPTLETKALQAYSIPGVKDRLFKLKVPGAERMAMGAEFNAAEPRKNIRLHLVGHEGAVAFGRRGYGYRAEKFYNEMLFIRPAKWEGETVFPVVFEPYPEERVIRGVKLLSSKDSVNDAAASIALEITLKKGRRDVVYAALRDSAVFDIPGYGKAQGEYAFLSYDREGLRQATLVGGARLEARDISIRPARAAYEGAIASGVASEKTLVLSGELPKEAKDAVIEIGPATRPTSYAIKSIKGKRVVMHKDFALSMTRIKGFLKEDNMPFTNCKVYAPPGVPVSNEKGDAWWRLGPPYELTRDEKPWPAGGLAHPAEVPPKGKAVRLIDGPADPREHMREGERIWVLEIGIGDAYRLASYVNVTRRAGGGYEVKSNVAAAITVAGKPLAPPKK